MSIDIWHRMMTTVRERYRNGALAQYGVGLHIDCDDCATPPVDVVVPAPRQRSVDHVPAGHVPADQVSRGVPQRL